MSLERVEQQQQQQQERQPQEGEAAMENHPSLIPRLVSGSIGSLVTSLAVTPLEVVKVRQQAQQSESVLVPNTAKPCSRGCGTFVLNNGVMDCVLPRNAVPYFCPQSGKAINPIAPVAPTRSLGTFGMVRRIFIQEGFAGIYAGLAPTLLMSVPNTVLYFTAYDEISTRAKKFVQKQQRDNRFAHIWIPLASGSSSRLLASFATAPLELIRTRQASIVATIDGTAVSRGVLQDLRHLVRSEGFLSLYQGLAPTLWRDIPFSAIYWLGLEQFKSLWKNSLASAEPATPLQQAGQAFCSGAAAGMIAAAATTPFDVVKTRHQIVQTSLPQAGSVVYSNAGLIPTMRLIVQEEGVGGLWRGNQARMMKVAPACAIMISCYELGKRLMEKQP